jgi:DNA-binding IclR family transcriptional regulator
VLVAFAEPEVRERLLASGVLTTSRKQDAYLQMLVEAREAGFATSVEEREEGAAAVSAPVFDRSHRLVAALAISGPSNRLTAEKMKQDAPLIMEAAIRMGKMIK